jgi:hypothetical protein
MERIGLKIPGPERAAFAQALNDLGQADLVQSVRAMANTLVISTPNRFMTVRVHPKEAHALLVNERFKITYDPKDIFNSVKKEFGTYSKKFARSDWLAPLSLGSTAYAADVASHGRWYLDNMAVSLATVMGASNEVEFLKENEVAQFNQADLESTYAFESTLRDLGIGRASFWGFSKNITESVPVTARDACFEPEPSLIKKAINIIPTWRANRRARARAMSGEPTPAPPENNVLFCDPVKKSVRGKMIVGEFRSEFEFSNSSLTLKPVGTDRSYQVLMTYDDPVVRAQAQCVPPPSGSTLERTREYIRCKEERSGCPPGSDFLCKWKPRGVFHVLKQSCKNCRPDGISGEVLASLNTYTRNNLQPYIDNCNQQIEEELSKFNRDNNLHLKADEISPALRPETVGARKWSKFSQKIAEIRKLRDLKQEILQSALSDNLDQQHTDLATAVAASASFLACCLDIEKKCPDELASYGIKMILSDPRLTSPADEATATP